MKKTYKKHFFGIRKSDNAGIYLSGPSWDCGWYWSFGYLGNKDEHYHLDNYQAKDHLFKLEDGSFKYLTEKRNESMFDCLKTDYELCKSLKDDTNLWKFCELAKTAYTLKETAAVLGRGGSHYTKNPCKDIITNAAEVDRINTEVLPAIFEEIEGIFTNR